MSITLSTNLIKDALSEFKAQKSRGRREDVVKKLDYYTGCNMGNYITDRFKNTTFQEIPVYESNITKKFINKISRNYTVFAERNSNNIYKNLTQYKNFKFKHIERMTKLLGSVAVQVIWRENKGNPYFDYHPVYYFDIVTDSNNPFNPIGIIYPIMNAIDDVSNTDLMPYVYWDDTQYIEFDANGSIIKQAKHGYGVLPFIFTHKEPQTDSFFVEGANDIVNCNEHLNIAMTELMLGLRFQMFGQPFAIGVYEDQPIARTGTDTIINLPEGAQFGITSPQGNVESVIKAMKFQVELVAQNNHLWVSWAEEGDRPASGISLMIRDFERMEDMKDDVELWRIFEHKCYEVEKAVAKFNNINLPDKFDVNFEEPYYPRAVGDQIMLDNWKLERGHITDAEIMVRDNRDLSIKQAEKIIEANKLKNNIIKEEKEEE